MSEENIKMSEENNQKPPKNNTDAAYEVAYQEKLDQNEVSYPKGKSTYSNESTDTFSRELKGVSGLDPKLSKELTEKLERAENVLQRHAVLYAFIETHYQSNIQVDEFYQFLFRHLFLIEKSFSEYAELDEGKLESKSAHPLYKKGAIMSDQKTEASLTEGSPFDEKIVSGDALNPITDYLSIKDLAQLGQTSRTVRQNLKEKINWRSRISLDIGPVPETLFGGVEPTPGNYKAYYVFHTNIIRSQPPINSLEMLCDRLLNVPAEYHITTWVPKKSFNLFVMRDPNNLEFIIDRSIEQNNATVAITVIEKICSSIQIFSRLKPETIANILQKLQSSQLESAKRILDSLKGAIISLLSAKQNENLYYFVANAFREKAKLDEFTRNFEKLFSDTTIYFRCALLSMDIEGLIHYNLANPQLKKDILIKLLENNQQILQIYIQGKLYNRELFSKFTDAFPELADAACELMLIDDKIFTRLTTTMSDCRTHDYALQRLGVSEYDRRSGTSTLPMHPDAKQCHMFYKRVFNKVIREQVHYKRIIRNVSDLVSILEINHELPTKDQTVRKKIFDAAISNVENFNRIFPSAFELDYLNRVLKRSSEGHDYIKQLIEHILACDNLFSKFNTSKKDSQKFLSVCQYIDKIFPSEGLSKNFTTQANEKIVKLGLKKSSNLTRMFPFFSLPFTPGNTTTTSSSAEELSPSKTASESNQSF
jgi:hypothetical protein